MEPETKLVFLFRHGDIPERYSNQEEKLIKLSQGDFKKCISEVAGLHGVDMKPFQIVPHRFLGPAELVFTDTLQQIPVSSNTIRQN